MQWKAFKKIISYYTWALKIAVKEKGMWVFLVIFSYIGIRLMPNVELMISKTILSQIEKEQRHGLYLGVLLVGLLLVFILVDVGNVIYMLFYEKIRYVVSNHLFEKVVARLNRQKLSMYEKTEGNEFAERLVSSARYDLHNLISGNLSFYATAMEALVYVVMIAAVAPGMMLPMLLVSLAPYCRRMNEAEEESALSYELQPAERQMEYYNKLMTDGKVIKELRLYHSFPKVCRKWENAYRTAFEKRSAHFSKWNGRKAVYKSVSHVLKLGILTLTILLYYKKQISFSTLFFLWQCQTGLNASVGWIATVMPNSYGSVRRMEECRSFIEEALKEDVQNDQNTANSKVHTGAVSAAVKQDTYTADDTEIQLSHVGFQYEEGTFAIKDVSLQLKQNEILALLGENGSGKSTLIKLILGLYQPDSGEIYYMANGKEQSAGDFFGCVFQDYASYHLTLRENAGLGSVADIDASERIKTHLQEVNCQDILDGVNGNLEMTLGKLFDLEGKELSKGQWQRLANARALYGEHFALVFDEPTANLDPMAELAQMRELRKKLEGKTVILVSHRIGFARIADSICYMEDGKIVEKGSHNALMQKKGRYYELFQSQAQWYDWREYV